MLVRSARCSTPTCDSCQTRHTSMQALLRSGALVLSVSRAATSEMQSEDCQQLSRLLSVCLPGCGASCAEVADVLAEVGKTLQPASSNTKVRYSQPNV